MRYVKRRERERERNGGRDLCALYNTDYGQYFMLRVIFFSHDVQVRTHILIKFNPLLRCGCFSSLVVFVFFCHPL